MYYSPEDSLFSVTAANAKDPVTTEWRKNIFSTVKLTWRVLFVLANAISISHSLFFFFFLLSILIAWFAFNVFVTFQGLKTMPWDLSVWNMSNSINAVLTNANYSLFRGLIEGHCLRNWNPYAAEAMLNKESLWVFWFVWSGLEELIIKNSALVVYRL